MQNEQNNSMAKAISLAIEKGGWRDETWMYVDKNLEADIVLDPLFWQALGKALGWGCNCSSGNDYLGPDEQGDPIWGSCPACVVDGQYVPVKDWLAHAHAYFDLVLIGGDTEKFWKELLN
jgi:hypothetical protein